MTVDAGRDAGIPRILTARRIVTAIEDWSPGWVLIDGERIVACGQGAPPEWAVGMPSEHVDGVIAPGLVDIHAHGALGADFTTADDEAVRRIVRHHTARGTTRMLASLASAALADLEAGIGRLARFVEDGVLAGIHLEGPYLSPAHRGAHSTELLRTPDLREVRRLVDAGRGTVRVVTIAPELPGADAVIEWLSHHGVVIAMGHSDATAAITRRAIDRGATIATHVFNGMRPMHHRELGIAGTALLDDRVTLEVILDGHHLSSDAVDLVWRMGSHRVALVSDAMAATGAPDGMYDIAGSRVQVTNRVAHVVTGGSLAGSTITLADAAERAVRGGTPLADALRAASTTPATAVGLGADIAPGFSADLIVVRDDLDDTPMLNRVMRRGRWLK